MAAQGIIEKASSGIGRRQFVGLAAGAVVATQVLAADASDRQSVEGKASGRARSQAPLLALPLKQIHAGVLDVGYVEAGPLEGPAVILLHGWPYDIHSFVEVIPRLAAAGFRVIVPYTRGYGTTSFLSDQILRTGQPSALAVDTVALMDALNIRQATVAGFDWGARTADILGALWADRVKGLVSVSGYLIGSQEAGKKPLPPKAELQWWYQYYFATDRGREGYAQHTHDFVRLIWEQASPQWHFDDDTFERSAPAFNNVDHVAVSIHNYRWR